LTKSLKEYAFAAEIVGAAAVVVSLLYVGFSVNQNTNAVLVTNHQALVAMEQVSTEWFKDPNFAEAYIISSEGIDKLSPVQRAQLGEYLAGKFNTWEFAFITHENEMMEDSIWQGWNAYYWSVLKEPGGQWYWSAERENFSPAFSLYVDSLVGISE
jgi:hypothetical protein